MNSQYITEDPRVYYQSIQEGLKDLEEKQEKRRKKLLAEISSSKSPAHRISLRLELKEVERNLVEISTVSKELYEAYHKDKPKVNYKPSTKLEEELQ